MASEALFGTNTNNLDAGLSTSLQNSTKLNSASNPLGNNSALTSLQPTFRASNFGNALAESPSSDWVSEGKFGDFNGRNDFQLTINFNGKQETFSLTGDGYGEVFKDINNNYEYVSFAGTDKTTKIQISAINNIRFGDYLGSTLNVQTEGSITAGNITLQNTKASTNPGLVLRSGLSDVQNSTTGSSYRITDLGVLPGGSYSRAVDINNSGQIIGNSYASDGWDHAFLYSDGTMTDLGTLPGGKSSYAYGINDRGQVVGEADSSDGPNHAFLYSDGTMTDLGTLPGSRYSVAYDINNRSQVVGYSDDSNGFRRAFLYSDGLMTDLATLPGSIYGVARNINDSGQVVGSDGRNHAFLYSDGLMTDLGTLPEYNFSYATGINDSGQVVGESYGGSNGWKWDHAFLYSSGTMTDLGTLPGGRFSYALDINNRSQVVGYSDDSNGFRRAFLYSDGKMTDLNSLIPSESGWDLDRATAINDFGQIAGIGVVDNQRHSFLLDPISGLTPTPQDGITVGNISTLGDSISLQGLKITLTGTQILTKGGNITLDGPTILNSSTGAIAFNSTKSAKNSKGGNITFTNTLDGASAGTQSLGLTAGTGSIALNKAVGGSAALKDFAVNSAKSFTSGDITTDGDTTITATSGVTTGKLTSNSGAAKLTSSQGSVTTNDITTSSNATVSAKQNLTTGTLLSDNGAIKLTSNQGTVATSDITTSSDTTITASQSISTGTIRANSGAVSLTSKQSSVTTKDITTAGNTTVTAKLEIANSNLLSHNGAVKLTSNQGTVATSDITSSSDTTITAEQRIDTGSIVSNTGAVKLTSLNSSITTSLITTGGNATSSSSGNQANIALTAASLITTGNISTHSIGKVSITLKQDTAVAPQFSGDVTTGSINASQLAILSSGGVNTQGDITTSGGVVISAGGDVTSSNIQVQGGVVGLFSSQGAVTTQGDIITDGRSVNIVAGSDVATRNIQTNGGRIYLISLKEAVTTGFLRSDSSGTGGDVYVYAPGLFRATGSVLINGTNYSIYTGTTENASIMIEYGGGAVNPAVAFVIGDATTNGTIAAISTGSYTALPLKSPVSNYTLASLNIIPAGSGSSDLLVANVPGGSIGPGSWNPPGNQPIPYYIGSEAHKGIADFYKSMHPNEQVFANYYPIRTILTAFQARGEKPNTNALSPAELDGNKPDILNVPKHDIYEIKSEGQASSALPQALKYTAIFGKAGIIVNLGPSTEPGTFGVIPAPGGYYTFASPQAGTIIYKYNRGSFSDIPENQTQQQSNPSNQDPIAIISRITGLTGTALAIYIIVSEGSRILFPPRNLAPIP